MRIVLVAPEIPDYALEYARVLSAKCNVLLIIPEKFRTEYPPTTPGLEICWAVWPRQRSLRSILFMIRTSRQIRRWRPDVVHCLDANYIWFNLLALFLASIPFVTTIHDIHVHPGDGDTQRVPRVVVKMLVRLSTALVVHGDKLRSGAIKDMPIDHTRIFVFPHPPITRYLELAKKNKLTRAVDGSFRILFFGRIQEYKGLRYLIEAAPAIYEKIPNAIFVIAGKGDNFSNYLDLMADPSRFSIHNRFIDDVEAAQMFVDADLLALPYIEASQSGVLLLALPFELPVVATDVGEMGETVRSMDMGIVVPPRNPSVLASAVIELASSAARKNEMQANMRRIMNCELSPTALSARALRMYEQILELGKTTSNHPTARDQGQP